MTRKGTESSGVSPGISLGGTAGVQVRKLGLWGVIMVIYFAVAGGAFGIEPLIASSGPGMALILILVTPFIYSVPTALMVTELATAMPVAGGYYAWVRRGLGPFWAFMQGWSSWLYGLVIAASFGVLFANYTSSFLNLAFSVTVLDTQPLLKWLVVALISSFVLLNVRGAHAVGDSSKLFAAMVFAPFIVMIVPALVNGSPTRSTSRCPSRRRAPGCWGPSGWACSWCCTTFWSGTA